MTGLDLIKVIYGSSFKFSKTEVIEELKEVKDKVLEKYHTGEKLDRKPRILLTGCPVGGATQKVIEAIENNSAYVVYYESCTGGKAVEELVEESSEDIYDALTKKYLNIGCSCISPNTSRFDLVGRVLEEYSIDGVVDMELSSCHPYSIETYFVKEFVRKRDIPYISIVTDYSKGDIGQLTIRLTAFIEML